MPVTYPTNATYSTYLMADRKPDRGFSQESTFDTILFESQGGYEARRQRSRRPKRRFTFTYTNINGGYKRAIQDFYNARAGDYEAFFFDLSHVNSSGTIGVRFDGSLQITQVASLSLTDDTLNIYTVSFAVKEVFI